MPSRRPVAGARLGLPDAAKWTVTDAEAGTSIGKDWSAAAAAPVTLAGDTLKVPVARHDYRQVIVEQP